MLRLRPFELHQPTSLSDAVDLLAAHGDRARVIAGGTDLVPNLKLAQVDAEVLVSLSQIDNLGGVSVDGGELVIGARARLSQIAGSPLVRQHAPALAEACGRIASPQIRNAGTLGGNLCLDTRCRYINQSELFRQALGGCLKSHGVECHVVPGGPGCVAAQSSDSVPVLIAMDARVQVLSAVGTRTLSVHDLYGTDGIRNLAVGRGELVTGVRVPLPPPGSHVAYRKWAVRKSIDFPLVSVCVRLDVAAGALVRGVAVVGALGPRPKRVELSSLASARLDAELAGRIGDLVHRKCKPLPNIPYDPEYRRARLRVEARRAALSLIEEVTP